MADYAAPTANDEPSATSWWALGFLFFAIPIAVMAGMFQFLLGLAAVIKGEFFIAPPNYAYKLDPNVWGWIHMLIGVLMIVTALFLADGRPWARIVAIIVAAISAVANFFFIPYYPIWSIIIIAFDVVIIWAVARYGRDLQAMMS